MKATAYGMQVRLATGFDGAVARTTAAPQVALGIVGDNAALASVAQEAQMRLRRAVQALEGS